MRYAPFDFDSHRGWLRGLLAFDFACAIYMLLWIPAPALRKWYLNTAFDWSLPEFVQYAKALVAAYLLFRAGKRAAAPLYSALGAIYVFLALDDGLWLHEGIGGRLLGPRLFGATDEAYHQGQVVYALLFLAIVAPLLGSLMRRSSESQRRAGLYFIGTLVLLGVSAVVIDFFAGYAPRMLGWIMNVLEELGEHLALTFALWFALVLKTGEGSSRPSPGTAAAR